MSAETLSLSSVLGAIHRAGSLLLHLLRDLGRVMKLTQFHRALLAQRTYLNKFGIEVGYDDQHFVQALRELVDEGYVTKIDSNFFHAETGRLIDVYQLTDRGVELCRIHNIVAHNP